MLNMMFKIKKLCNNLSKHKTNKNYNEERCDMKQKLLKIIEHFGLKNQLRKLAEENYELFEAIAYDDGTIDSLEHIIEELSDNLVLLRQMQYYYDIDDNVLEEQIDKKIERTIKRINNKYYDKLKDFKVRGDKFE